MCHVFSTPYSPKKSAADGDRIRTSGGHSGVMRILHILQVLRLALLQALGGGQFLDFELVGLDVSSMQNSWFWSCLILVFWLRVCHAVYWHPFWILQTFESCFNLIENHRTSWIMLFKLKAQVLVVTCCVVWAHPIDPKPDRARPIAVTSFQVRGGGLKDSNGFKFLVPRKEGNVQTYFLWCIYDFTLCYVWYKHVRIGNTHTHTHSMSSIISDEFPKTEATVSADL